MTKFNFLGIEEIEMTCEFCKKQHIGKAYTFRNLESGDVVRFGSTCAKKALGLSTSKLETMKAKAKYEITMKYQDMISKLDKLDTNGRSALFQEQIKTESLYK